MYIKRGIKVNTRPTHSGLEDLAKSNIEIGKRDSGWYYLSNAGGKAMGEILAVIFDKLFKRWEGLSLAVVMLGFFLAQTYLREGRLREGHLGMELLITVGIWVAALILHWIGTYLDKPLYNSLFGTKGKFPNVIGTFREPAKKKYHELAWDTEELQETSRTLFERSEEWEKTGKTSYEISKAARSFIFPLSALFLYQIASLLCQRIPSLFGEGLFFGRPYVLAGLLVLAVVLYLALRVQHNRALYRLVAQAKPVCFEKDRREEKLLEIEVLRGRKKDGGFQYSFYCRRDKT